jgi:hypothetical protein
MNEVDGIKDDLKNYEKLSRINKSQEFNDFFDLQIKTVVDKMLWTFIGDNIKTIEDFYKLKGEVTAYLYPIQEIRTAKELKEQLEERLNQYYGKTLD